MTQSDRVEALAQAVGEEIKTVRVEIAAGGATLQGELDALSDVVATKATTSNVDAQLAVKANAADLDNVFGIATAAIPSSQKAAANGVATLGSDSKLPAAQLPALAITEFLGSSANQTAMLAKTGEQGDWTTRTDLGTVWIITGSDPTQLSSWTQMTYPTAPVTSVAGQTGVVVLAKADVGLNNVDNTSDANKPVSTAQQTALNAKVNTADVAALNTTGWGRAVFIPNAGTVPVGTPAYTIVIELPA